jgi:glycosyltransferase involved in cell wall biosynthesis
MSKTILIITHVIPEPANTGDALRLRNLIRFFRGQGYKIICLFHSDACKKEIISNNKKLIDYIYFSNNFRNISTMFNRPYQVMKTILHGGAKAYFYDLHLSLAVKRLCKQYNPSIIMAEYIFMAPYLKYASPATLKITDTIDVFARKKKEVCDRGVDFPLACTKKEERKYLLNGDVVLGIQPDETRMLADMVPEKRVINVGVDMPCNISTNLPKEKTRDEKSILIVAGSNPNNVHGVNQFLQESWPDIYKTDSNVSLRVVGSVCKHVLKEIVLDGVELVGLVDDLSVEYENADIVINPVVAGTGLKIKTIEAMSFGKPIISTPNGVEGIVVDEHEKAPFVIAESSVDFVNKVLYLLDSDKYRHALELTVASYAKKYLVAEYVYNDLNNAVIKNSNNILSELKTRKNCFSFIKDLYSCYIILRYGSYDKQYYSKQCQNYPNDFFYKKLWNFHSSSNNFFKKISSFLFHPVVHYVYKGVYDGCDLIPDFNSYYYLHTNYKKLSEYFNPYSNYLKMGKLNGLAPTNEFVSAKYLFEKINARSKKFSSFSVINFLNVIGS